MRIAVVGAGPAGLVAARTLVAAGASVSVFDKGRRPGGRISTREHGSHRFDHGAQFFTVRDARIRPLAQAWLEHGVVTEWKGSIVHIDRRGTRSADPATRYVARPGMVDLALHMADGLDIRTGVRIEKATPEGAGTRGDTATREGTANGWRLHDADGRSCGSFDGLVLAVPAPQAVPLLSAVPDLRAVVAGVEMEPCWAGMMVFASPPPLPFDAAFLEDAALSWVARDASKPDRPAHEAWVVHATPAWTRAHWDMDREAVAAELERVLSSRFGPLPDVTFSRAHRWGYALASGAPVGILHDTRHRIGVCGDWCVGGRVEGALSSGIQIAERMLA